MSRITPSLNLTTSQTEVMIKISAASTPHLARAETEAGEKAITASGILLSIGAIKINSEGAFVTDYGKQIMRDTGMLDDNDELTGIAHPYLNTGGENQSAPPDAIRESSSWEMICEFNNLLKFR